MRLAAEILWGGRRPPDNLPDLITDRASGSRLGLDPARTACDVKTRWVQTQHTEEIVLRNSGEGEAPAEPRARFAHQEVRPPGIEQGRARLPPSPEHSPGGSPSRNRAREGEAPAEPRARFAHQEVRPPGIEQGRARLPPSPEHALLTRRFTLPESSKSFSVPRWAMDFNEHEPRSLWRIDRQSPRNPPRRSRAAGVRASRCSRA